MADILSIAAEDMLASANRKLLVGAADQGRLEPTLLLSVCAPPTGLIGGWDKCQQHLPGDEAWLIGEPRVCEILIASLPATADLRAPAGTIKAQRICEHAHQGLKEELGLDHFEGRSWEGLHRHALMTMIAHIFLQNLATSPPA